MALNDFIVRTESDYICDSCGAKVLESDNVCRHCKEPLYEDDNESEVRTGYNLMCLGAVIYVVVTIISYAYTPDSRDIEDAVNYGRTMGIAGFIGVLIFMIGSIMQVKELMSASGK